MDYTADPKTLVLLGLSALVAGFVDAIAGGGGLITMPALLLAGASPVAAIGTNKSQSVFGTAIATGTVVRKGLLDATQVRPAFVRSMAGSALGALVVQQIDVAAFDVIVPVVIAGIGGYFLFTPSIGKSEGEPRISNGSYQNRVVPVIGFYDGFFGPGTGSFFALAGVTLRGYELVKSTAAAKALNLASNLAAVAVFVVGGKILWSATAVMMAGQFIGASVGTRTMISGGSKIIRPLVVCVSAAMLIRWFVA